MTRKLFAFLSVIVLCLMLCACGVGKASVPKETPAPTKVTFSGGTVGVESTELTMPLQSGETALLDMLPALKTADLSGSADPTEVSRWAKAHPDIIVTFTVTLPDGSVLDNGAKSAELSALSGAQLEESAALLSLLPKLEFIELGNERGNVSWDNISALTAVCPQAEIRYTFNLYGNEVNLSDTQLNLSHAEIYDGGAALGEAMRCMTRLDYVDLDSSTLTNEECAALRNSFPAVKIVWRIWFGDAYSVRTDVERILASKPSIGGMLTAENTQALKYCTDVKYIDIGHNEELDDISFIAYMPKLEVAVLAMEAWSDATPLASCTELEYLEMQTTNCTDLSPLAGLTKLRHLNVAHILELTDISPLYALTELERLWVGSWNHVPKEQIEEMRRAAPNCEVNDEVYDDPTGGRWRYVDYNDKAYVFILHDRYIKLQEQFGYTDADFSVYWNDPLYW